MAKTSIAAGAIQEATLREGLEAAIRERVREVIELILEEEVDTALGPGAASVWPGGAGIGTDASRGG